MNEVSAAATAFWGRTDCGEHLLQVYKDQGAFMDGLAEFAGSGLRGGEAVVVIATAAHRASLQARLRADGHDLDRACAEHRYLALDAAGTLARIMVDGWPDPARFEQVIGEVVARARGAGRRVRAYGEMVALLWADDRTGATLRLEQLWNDFMRQHELVLLCGYPRIGSTHEIGDAFAEVCAAHSQVAFT